MTSRDWAHTIVLPEQRVIALSKVFLMALNFLIPKVGTLVNDWYHSHQSIPGTHMIAMFFVHFLLGDSDRQWNCIFFLTCMERTERFKH